MHSFKTSTFFVSSLIIPLGVFCGDVPFITLKDGVLYEGDNPFRFVSINVPGLFMNEDKPECMKEEFGFPVCQTFPIANPSFDKNGYAYGSIPGTNQSCIENPVPCRQIFPASFVDDYNQWEITTPYEQEDLVQTVALMAGRVIRTFPFLIGMKQHVNSLRSYHEPAWVAVDNAIALAQKYNVRLIIPFFNNHWKNSNPEQYLAGDIGYFTRLRQLPASAFYSDATVIEDFKHFLTFVLNRVNTVTGVRYGDDPTILAWETGNELGGAGVTNSDAAQTAAWTIEIAKFIKSLAPKTLVMDGHSAKNDCPTQLQEDSLKSPYVDIFSAHYYDPDDYDRIGRDTKFVTGYGKAFIIGEFGMEGSNTYKPLIEAGYQTKVSGMMYWSLRGHSNYGGFYTHRETFGTPTSQLSWHAPGFESQDKFSGDEREGIDMLIYYAHIYPGYDTNVGYPEPPAVQPLDIPVHPARLRFRGSAWAQKYNIQRRVCEDAACATISEDWKEVANGIQDNFLQGTPILSEKDDNLRGKFLAYQIEPIGRSGKKGKVATIGPYKFSN